MFQYSLGVKREEMLKLEQIASVQEKKLELAEHYLEEDAAIFDEFLKDNDKTSGDAIKMFDTHAFVIASLLFSPVSEVSVFQNLDRYFCFEVFSNLNA